MASPSKVTKFIITGLFQMCFIIFLAIYLAILVGNSIIVLVVSVSEMEICYSSTVAPKFIANLLTEIKTISFKSFLAQIFFFHFFGVAEILLLVVMAYDCYVAICRPLHYMNVMSHQMCHILVAGSWLVSFVHSLVQIIITMALPFSGLNVIDHYFCDLQPLFKLASTDTFLEGVIIFANSGLVALYSFLVLVFILVSLRNHSAEGKLKALSTCASHIIMVILLFGPAIFLYLHPSSTYTEDKLFYTIITAMVNPIVCTLRNAEMKFAKRNLWSIKKPEMG
uniref:G-protein coupled receptors family 1 profile domain-containing protein n=1 Tax=Cavia porcellus TaxID=10141 RepID=A0A286XDE1_CAVPO